MDLILPDLGLFFWTLVIFLVVMFLLRKLAWKPINNALLNREKSIEDALNEAKLARQEMANLKAENEKIIKEAKIERDKILKEAKDTKDQIINEARDAAKEEGQVIIEETRNAIEKEKERAFNELKNRVADIALGMASKVIKSELDNSKKQEEIVKEYLKEANLI